MWKNSLKNVESDNNKFFYESFLDSFFTAKRYLLSEEASYISHFCEFRFSGNVQPSQGTTNEMTKHHIPEHLNF